MVSRTFCLNAGGRGWENRILNRTLLLEYNMNEKIIICIECGNPFTLTVAQQERIIALEFDEPKRCRACREEKIIASVSRYEEKMSYKNVDPEWQWEFIYNIRKKRDALIVSGNGSRSSFKYLRLISMMEDDEDQ